MTPLPWLWIPLTIWAGFAQTLRNAAQRHLVSELGTLGATLVRFLYGLPFAALWFAIVLGVSGDAFPPTTLRFLAWVVGGALMQIAATALLLRVMQERNFTLGVAYSKTEVMQVGVFGVVFLGDPLGPLTIVAILLAMAGVLCLSTADSLRTFFTGWTSRSALLGLASGASFGLAATGYRGGALALGEDQSYLIAAAYTLVWAQTLQTLFLGGWLAGRDFSVVGRLIRAWRTSVLAGFMGAAASIGWFTAMAIEPVAHVRTLGLIELLFSYLLSRRIFREKLRRVELAGMVLLMSGLVVVTLRG